MDRTRGTRTVKLEMTQRSKHKMKCIFLFQMLLLTSDLFSQTSTATISVKKGKTPVTYYKYDRPAYFKDSTGVRDMLFIVDFIKTNIKLPDSVARGLVAGKVFIAFTVTKNGSLENIRVLQGMKGCKSCDAEAIRLFSSMPNWTPAVDGSKVVSSKFQLPVIFRQTE